MKALADSTVLLVGAGGLGCPAGHALARSGVGRLVVVDDDTVEGTNLHRQILFTEADLGRPKATVAAERLMAAGAPRAPGMLPRHYAPRTRLRLLTATDLLQGLAADGGAGIAVLACTAQAPAGFRGIWRRLPASSGAYARGLYAELRLLDELGAREIRVEQPPAGDDWAPVADRLRRAAA